MSDVITYDSVRRRWVDEGGKLIAADDARLENRFRSHVGHHPTFFVSDTGAVGATATLSTPKGASVELTGDPVGSDDSTFGRRVGFELPRLTYPGEYTLTVDDGTVYIVEVLPARRVITDRFTGKEKLVNTVEEAQFFGGDEGVEEIVP